MMSDQSMRVYRYLFIVIWALVAAEVFLRIFAPVPMLPRYISATDYGVRGNMANQNYWHKTPDYKVNIRINSRGARADRDFPFTAPDGVKRIVVLGDSFGMGYGVNIEDTFLARMSDKLDVAGVRTEVINLSVSGHGTAEELLTLRYEGLKYKPDLVLVIWHSTDPNNNRVSNLFDVDNGELVVRNTEYLPAVKIREFLFSFSAYRWLASNSHLYTGLREQAASTTRRLLAAIAYSGPVWQAEQSSASESAEVGRLPDELSLALLREIASETEAVDAKLLILAVPRKLARDAFETVFPRDSTDGYYGLRVLDPVPIFEQQDGAQLYWERSHGHFTPLGCRLVGDLLADYLLRENLLAE